MAASAPSDVSNICFLSADIRGFPSFALILTQALGGNNMAGPSRVSVVIPVHNGSATIKRAIDSVFSQSYAAFEVIVVDDGSTDCTARILRSYGDRIIVLRQPNRGPSAARNAGTAAASRLDYIAFLDADDAWLSEMLSTMVSRLDSTPLVVLAFSNVITIDDDGREVHSTVLDDKLAHAPSMDELLTRWWPILTSATLIRREAFERCSGFSEAFTSPGYEDTFMWLVLREQGEFLYEPRPLVHYRITSPAQRMFRYSKNYSTFLELVGNRYGTKSRRLTEDISLGFVAMWGYQGLIALKMGDRILARQLFERALACRPLHVRTVLRWARTFLPISWSAPLSGSLVNGEVSDKAIQESVAEGELVRRAKYERAQSSRYVRPLVLKRPPNINLQ